MFGKVTNDDGLHIYTLKRPTSEVCRYYCFFATESQEKLNQFISAMEAFQILVNSTDEYLQVVVYSSKTIPYNSLGNCYKLPERTEWYGLHLNKFDEGSFYNFSNMDLCIGRERADARINKGVDIVFDSLQEKSLNDFSQAKMPLDK